jgi:hypothetical protein
MSDYQDQLATMRLIETIQAVGVAVERAEGGQATAGSVPSTEELVFTLPTAIPTERSRRVFPAAVASLAALLIVGLLGIVLLVGRTGPQPVQPGSGLAPSQSTVTGVPPATSTAPGPSPAPTAPTPSESTAG